MEMLMTNKLWIIEDIEDLQKVYNDLFSEISEITYFKSFNDFMHAYQLTTEDNVPDLIIADLLLEDGQFFKLLNEFDLSLTTPFMCISSYDDLTSMRNAFEAGAIDFITKPLNLNEVKVKVENHINKIVHEQLQTSKSLEALKIDFSNFTNKECKILESFMTNADKTLHRNEIVQHIWGNSAIHPNTLDVHIYNLRKKLKEFDYGVKAVGNGLFKFLDYNKTAM